MYLLKDVNGVFCDFSVHCIHTHYHLRVSPITHDLMMTVFISCCVNTCTLLFNAKMFLMFFFCAVCEKFIYSSFPPSSWKRVLYGNVSTCSNIWQRDLDGAACYKVNRKVKVDKTTRHANVSMV